MFTLFAAGACAAGAVGSLLAYIMLNHRASRQVDPVQAQTLLGYRGIAAAVGLMSSFCACVLVIRFLE